MQAPSKAEAQAAPSVHLTLRVQCEAVACGALLEVRKGDGEGNRIIAWEAKAISAWTEGTALAASQP